MACQTRSYLGWGPGNAPVPVGGPVHVTEEAEPVAHEADSRLEDPLVLDEIELYGELVIAASSSDEPLSQAEIDHVLGLRRGSASRSA